MCYKTEDRRIRIRIDDVDTASKPTNHQVSQISTRLNRPAIELTLEGFAKLVVTPHSRTWVPADFNGNRSNDNWKSQDVFALDFDGKIDLETFMDRIKLYGLSCNLIYSTFSSTDEKPRFRGVFVLKTGITDLDTRDIIMESFLKLFPEADPCKDRARIFYGGNALLYHDFEHFASPEDIFHVGNINRLGNVSPNYGARELKKVLEKRKTINNIIEQRKNNTFKIVRTFDYNQAREEVRIFDDFMNGKWLYHNELFGIATNLSHVEGGLLFMKDTMDKAGQYSKNNYNILAYARVMKEYQPMRLSNFSPYPEDHTFTNILVAGKPPKGTIQRLEPQQTVTLAEAEKSLETISETIKISKDNKVHVVCASTGIGKTRILETWENAVICFPNHKLKDEVSDRMRIHHWTTENLLERLSKEDYECVQHCFKVGAVERGVQIIRSKIEQNDLSELLEKSYQYLLEMSYGTVNLDPTVLTTHAKSQFGKFPHDVIIYDEDPLTSSFLRMYTSYTSDLISIRHALTSPVDQAIMKRLIEVVTDTPRNIIAEMPRVAFDNYNEIEEIAIKDKSLKGNILDFINCKHFIVDTNDPNKLRFLVKKLPPEDKKIVVFSATADRWIYDQLFGERLSYNDLGHVELAGSLIQDSTYPFSRQSMSRSETIKYAQEKVEDRIVITFKEYTKHFKKTYKNIYFGNAQGIDYLKGQRLAIVGTPHVDPGTYLLYAKALNLDLKPEDFRIKMYPVHRNGFYFNFFTYKNEYLRNLQFYFIERELRQAIGRGRLTRRGDADVLVLSNYPLPEARQLNEIA